MGVKAKKYPYQKINIYYWASAYSEQMKRGGKYTELHKTISIIILDHEIRELEGIEELGTKWQIRDEKTGKRILTNQLELVILEIPKAKRIYRENNQDKISQWLMFLDDPNMKEVSDIVEENKEIREANEELDKMSDDEELKRRAELREKYIRDSQAELEFAERKKAMDIAKNLIKKGLDIDFIEETTGLDKETIGELKKG